MQAKKIAVLTSGGDAQGMNTAINIITRVATQRGIKVLGVLEGYKGLVENNFKELTLKDVENISDLGGTILKTARYDDFRKPEVVDIAIQNLKDNHVDALIVIGGDGSFNGALALQQKRVKVVAIPATIDNDLRYTNKCLGFDTAVNNACKFIENVKQTMSSLERGTVFEVMGRYCGDIALHCAAATACDIVVLPEKPITEAELVCNVKEFMANNGRQPVIVVAEKMFDVVKLASKLSKVAKTEFKYSIVGYLQRGGAPTVGDKTLAMQYAVRAVDLIEKGEFGKAIGINGTDIFEVDIKKALHSEYNFNYELLSLFYSLNSKI